MQGCLALSWLSLVSAKDCAYNFPIVLIGEPCVISFPVSLTGYIMAGTVATVICYTALTLLYSQACDLSLRLSVIL